MRQPSTQAVCRYSQIIERIFQLRNMSTIFHPSSHQFFLPPPTHHPSHPLLPGGNFLFLTLLFLPSDRWVLVSNGPQWSPSKRAMPFCASWTNARESVWMHILSANVLARSGTSWWNNGRNVSVGYPLKCELVTLSYSITRRLIRIECCLNLLTSKCWEND